MGFFAPWFLAGLAGLALPVYLHLLKKQTMTPKEVSSLMFFESRTQSSTRHRRLRYYLLFALRAALLTLLILAFANPFINRNASALASSRIVLIVVDNSFSMRAGTRLEDAKRAAAQVLAGKGAARAQVGAFGSQLHMVTQVIEDPGPLRAALDSIQPGDGHNNYGELARAVRAMAEAVHVPIELHLFSDMQRSGLAANPGDMALPSNVTFVTHSVVTNPLPNWAVESVNAPGQVWGKDLKPIRVQAVIAGYGTDSASRTASLKVNGKTLATKAVAVPAGGRAAVEFQTQEIPYGFSRCEISIDSADGFAADDIRRFVIERSDPKKVLLVHNSTDSRSPVYFSTALAASAQAAFSLESVAASEAADRTPSNYAFIVLSDLNGVPSLLENVLNGYVRGGGSVLITAGTSAAGHTNIPIFGGRITETRDYTRSPERFASTSFVDSAYPPTVRSGDLSGVKVFYALNVDASGARVAARLGDQTPLLLEKRIGEGKVILLTTGLDNLTSDFPLQPAFVPFVEQTALYLAGSAAEGGQRSVDAYLDLRNGDRGDSKNGNASGATEITDPAGKRALSLTEAASAQSFQLTDAGYYRIRLASGKQNEIGVNPDPKESNLDVIPKDVLALWQGQPAQTDTPSNGMPAAPRTLPQSIWWYVMLAAVAASLIESVVASRYLGTQRDEE